MNRRLPNKTIVRYSNNTKSKRPYVVECHKNRVERVSFNMAMLSASTSYTCHRVGRYATEEAANDAAISSAYRHGGLADGLCRPLTRMPIKIKTPRNKKGTK